MPHPSRAGQRVILKYPTKTLPKKFVGIEFYVEDIGVTQPNGEMSDLDIVSIFCRGYANFNEVELIED